MVLLLQTAGIVASFYLQVETELAARVMGGGDGGGSGVNLKTPHVRHAFQDRTSSLHLRYASAFGSPSLQRRYINTRLLVSPTNTTPYCPTTTPTSHTRLPPVPYSTGDSADTASSPQPKSRLHSDSPSMRSSLLSFAFASAALAPTVLAFPEITSPAAGAVIPAGPITVRWTDNGETPLSTALTVFTMTLVVGGNVDVNMVSPS